MNITKYTLPVILTILLGACATRTPTATEVPNSPEDKKVAAKHILAAKHLSAWHIMGVVAAKNKQKAWSASINWKQQGLNRYQLNLFGPLGGGSVSVEKNGHLVTYKDGTKELKTTDIDQIFYKETGVRVPLHNLYYWVRGVQAPGTVQLSHKDEAGHYTSLTQGGYTISYENYQTVNGVDLPTKLRVTGPGGQLKLIIKQWEIH